MADTTFISGSVIQPDWLNDVNDTVYTDLGGVGVIGSSSGASKVGFAQSGTGAATRTALAKMRDVISVKDFGATGDGTTDDTTAIQNAITATPKAGCLYFPRGKYKITDELQLTKPILIVGDGPGHILEGYDTTDDGSYVVQHTNSKVAFRLVAGLNNYAFGQYGACGIHFQDICVQGRSNANKIVACIAADTTVNGGDYHIRGNSTTRCTFRYATDAVNFTGIAYLNNFYQTNFVFSTTGFKIARGAAPDSGGQTRFFGCLFEFCVDGASLNEDTVNGVFSFFGCTIADNTNYGIRTNDEVSLELHGNNFEANTVGAIYIVIPLAKSNANSAHYRNIVGNEFISNGFSVWVDKLTTAGSDGNFHFPTRFDLNQCNDALAIKLTVPSGEPGFGSDAFVIGNSNVGTSNGQLASSQVSSAFFGTWERKRRYSLRYSFTGSYTSGSTIALLPNGFVPTSARMYLTANASGFTNFQLGDQVDPDRYVNIANAQTQTLNTWVSWTPSVPQFVVDGTNNKLSLIGTGGILSAAGVIEIEGYVS